MPSNQSHAYILHGDKNNYLNKYGSRVGRYIWDYCVTRLNFMEVDVYTVCRH